MLQLKTIYIFLAFLVALVSILDGWAIFRGIVYTADLRLPGLKLEHGALLFDSALIGTYYDGGVLDQTFILNKDDPYQKIFTFSDRFPVPNLNSLSFPANKVLAYSEKAQYVDRCLKLETSHFPIGKEISLYVKDIPYYLYGYTPMLPNGTGIAGNICQQEFNDNTAYATMDILCNSHLTNNQSSERGLACMRHDLLLGCIPYWRFWMYHTEDCAQQNMLKKGLHWSGFPNPSYGESGWLKEDADQSNHKDYSYSDAYYRNVLGN